MDADSGEMRSPEAEIPELRFIAPQPIIDEKNAALKAGNASPRGDLAQKIKWVLPQHRSLAVQIVSYVGLVYAAFGFYNQYYLHWIQSPWFSIYSDRIAVLVFGIARIATERDAYTRRRLVFLVSAVTVLWLILPLYFGITFFNHHIFGTPWFFIFLLIVFLIGRRADCSWNCPCVGLRDTAGEPFRDRTIKGPVAFGLQNLKWVALASAVPILWIAVAQPNASWGGAYIQGFWTVHLNLFFASLLIIPFTGSRNYCRFLCPWGAMYGLTGRVGLFRVAADRERCIPCNLCESACDMGVPLRSLIEKRGEIKIADCVGCGRCVQACPRGALRLEDERDWLRRLASTARKSTQRS